MYGFDPQRVIDEVNHRRLQELVLEGNRRGLTFTFTKTIIRYVPWDTFENGGGI